MSETIGIDESFFKKRVLEIESHYPEGPALFLNLALTNRYANMAFSWINILNVLDCYPNIKDPLDSHRQWCPTGIKLLAK